MAIIGPQHFCVRWNSYHSNLQTIFSKLLTSEHFVDVTLACENALIKCHKVVLSACSTFFENILIQNPCKHPTIILKDMKFKELRALVDFMYKGEVNVTQDELPDILKAADSLKIRGLSGTDQQTISENLTSLNETQSNKDHDITPANLTKTAFTPIISVKPNSELLSKLPHNGSAPPTPHTESLLNNNLNKYPSTKILETELMKRKDKNDIKINGINESNNSTINAPVDLSGENKKEHNNLDGIKENGSISGDDDNIKCEIKEEEVHYNDDETDMEYYDVDDEGSEMVGAKRNQINNTDYPMANVSVFYNNNNSNENNNENSYTRRIRRSEEYLLQAAECITQGKTFQNVSDQFNIPISTIRFFMARKGILPKRKRGRGSIAPIMTGNLGRPISPNDNDSNRSGNSSPIGPPFHLVNFKLPEIEPALE